MASVSISCPSCSATDGVVRNGKSTAGHQRYLCHLYTSPNPRNRNTLSMPYTATKKKT
ncbi:IS1 family transposase, partial [Citrobacter portucalensis]|uniref:IS1 family transposase n=1 Tax=Citrobacter portucalensis TaxID=1639133 RepID=UPI003855BFA0